MKELIQKIKGRKALALGALFLILFFLFISFIFYRNLKKRAYKKEEKALSADNLVFKNLKVSILKARKKGAVVLKIKNIPSKVNQIEYELTYPTEDKGLQGVIGTIDDLSGSDYEKEIFLGTCSSGVCIQHKLAGKISLLLKFIGDFGEQTFEAEYSL